MKKIKKITMLAVGTTIMLNTAIFAVNGTVNAPSGLVLREEPARTGEPITTVEDKATVEIVEKSGEWYKVNYNGQEGYLFAEYVNEENQTTQVENPTNTEQPENSTTSENTPAEQIPPQENIPENPTTTTTQVSAVGTEVALKNDVKIYMIPLISSTPIGIFTAETTVKVEKEVTNWVYVTDGTQSGWIRTYLMNTKQEAEQPENQSTPNPEQTNVPEPTTNNTADTPSTFTKGTISVEFANVRKEANQTAEVITTLANGTTVTINAENEEWYKITYTKEDGTVYEGYIAKRLVTAE